jgi:hypothetical protein
VASKGSVEQSRDLTNRNRISGISGRTSVRLVAKSISIKGQRCRSGRCAVKAVGLTSGDLRCVPNGTEEAVRQLTAAQKSAEGKVGKGSRSTRLGHSPERGETAGLAGPVTTC